MVNSHFHLQRITRGQNRFAAREARYILCEKEFVKKQDELRHVEHVNLPDWAEGRALAFWESADMFERQKARLATMLTVSLPRELTLEEGKVLVRDYIDGVFEGTKVVTWGIHAPPASDGHSQPHAHILYSLRTLDGVERDTPEHFFKQYSSADPARGGAQKDLWFEKDTALYMMRNVWDDFVLQALERKDLATPPVPEVLGQVYDIPHTHHREKTHHLQRILTEDDTGQGLHYREREHSMEWSI